MQGTKCRCEVLSVMAISMPVRELRGCRILGINGMILRWRPSGVDARGDGPPTFALAPRPGELPVAVWRIDHAAPAAGTWRTPTTSPCSCSPRTRTARCPRAGASGRSPRATCSSSRPARSSARSTSPHAVTGRGLGGLVHRRGARAGRAGLGARPGAPTRCCSRSCGAARPGCCGWRCRPPTVRRGRRGSRHWQRELSERADGYREAVLAHLTLLLVEVARLAADVVGRPAGQPRAAAGRRVRGDRAPLRGGRCRCGTWRAR